MISFKSGFGLVAIFSFSLVSLPSSAFAGGGGESPVNPGVQPPQTPVSGNSSGGSLPTGIQPVSSISNLNNIQGSSFNYSNTQFSASGSGYQCGFSVGSSVSNANTSVQPVYTVDMRYNTAPCGDPKYQAELELKRTQIQAQGNSLQACIIARRDLAIAGKDPNLACPVVDSSQFRVVQ
jgi:hypothetical protein